MRIKIFAYYENGELSTEAFREDEEITGDYSDTELHEFEISEDEIQETSNSYLNDYEYFRKNAVTDSEIMRAVLEFSHRLVSDKSYAIELTELRQQIEKVAFDNVITNFINIKRIELEREIRGRNEKNMCVC